MSHALVVDSLCKSYRVFRRGSGFAQTLASLVRRQHDTVDAVRDVSFTLETGELVGFLGPNGAGKSTTIKMLAGILHPTSGSVVALGKYVPWRDRTEFVRNLGAVFGQKSQLVWDLPPQDSFRLHRSIHDLPRERYARRLEELVELLGIAKTMTQPTRTLSLGERMRCEFALALLHEPSILFLDEPTIGLDIEAKDRIRAFVKAINAAGTTVVLTTHDLQDIELLARRAIVIDKGRIVFDGGLEMLRARFGEHKRVKLRSRDFPADFAMPGLRVVGKEGEDRWSLELDLSTGSMHDFLEKLSGACRLEDLSLEDAPLEDAVRRLYNEGS